MLAESPRHMVVSLLIERENAGSIFTSIVSVEEHPNPSVNIKKYSVVAVGEANGFSTDGSLRSVTGVQEVIPTADEPFNCTLSPKQIDVSSPASTKGSGLTVTIIESASAHPKVFVPITIYSVVLLGNTNGLSMFTSVIESAGLHR